MRLLFDSGSLAKSKLLLFVPPLSALLYEVQFVNVIGPGFELSVNPWLAFSNAIQL